VPCSSFRLRRASLSAWSVNPASKAPEPTSPGPSYGRSNYYKSRLGDPRRGGRSKNAFHILLGLARPASQESVLPILLIRETELYPVPNTTSDWLDSFRRDLRPGVLPRKK